MFLQLPFQHKLIHLVLRCYTKQISPLNCLIQSLFAMHFLPFDPSLNCYFSIGERSRACPKAQWVMVLATKSNNASVLLWGRRRGPNSANKYVLFLKFFKNKRELSQKGACMPKHTWSCFMAQIPESSHVTSLVFF